VLHFVGHGNFYEDGGVLTFEDLYGAADHISSKKLQQALGGTSLRLVLLTSCRSAETDPADDFAGVAQALVRGGIPAVISMHFSISVNSVNVFDRAFYAALARRVAIDEAVTTARRALYASTEVGYPRDWGIPPLCFICRRNLACNSAAAGSLQKRPSLCVTYRTISAVLLICDPAHSSAVEIT